MLQRVPTGRPAAVQQLYWRAACPDGKDNGVVRLDNGGLRLAPGATACFDTYFGSFYEQHWRLHTRLEDLFLRLEVDGPFRLQLWRRSSLGALRLEDRTEEGGRVTVRIPRETVNYRQHGVLGFSVTAMDPGATFVDAHWCAAAGTGSPVGLAAILCTFNREPDVARVLAAIAEDGAVLGRLARVYVINQGRPGLEAHDGIGPLLGRFGDRLRILDQGNFGGAGGFTRGLIEALHDPAVTHAAFLDDDIRIEPDSLLRLASFFAHAEPHVPVGGHMLDLLQPLRLFEAGAIVDPRSWAFLPQHSMTDLCDEQALTALAEPHPVHYNGWWCFGMPLDMVRTVGLPLPCFIRGDDMEYGLRLHQRGIYTVPLPGVAVWHEPFYVKIGGWQLYYETRNLLIAATLHLGGDGRAMALRMARHLLIHLLTFRYYSAALIVRGIEDFLLGPSILDRDPRPLHAGLQSLRDDYASSTRSMQTVLASARVPPLPRARLGYAVALGRALLRGWFAPTRDVSPRRMAVQDFAWITLARADHVALDTGWDRSLPALHRSREAFRSLARQGARAILSLYRNAPDLACCWRDALPRLTSEAFWRAYLGLGPAASTKRAPEAARIPLGPDR